MKKLFKSRSLYITLALIVIVIVAGLILGVGQSAPPPLVTTSVETGTVQQLVSVSGVAEAVSLVNLAFPTPGIVASVFVRAGDTVTEDDIIATLDTRTLVADRLAASAELSTALANRAELIAGPTDTARVVTDETVRVRTEALASVVTGENAKVTNAYRTLLSSGLAAYTTNPNQRALPPTVSGTYTCATEGTYTIRAFSSNAQSGYSYALTGLETGTFIAATEQPSPLGTCGLQILFDGSSLYHNSIWTVPIPNERAVSYAANKNTYDLARTQAINAITIAEQELALAEATAIQSNAPARAEALARADAAVITAEARLARVDALIEERTLRAPFTGTITNINILPGESVANTAVTTLLATDAFEITARIPEIDMGKLRIGQKVLMRFDAKDDEYIAGVIDFISLNATAIDGVAYFEARITLENPPVWMRSGLNADIDIIVAEATDVLRIPKRFLTTENGNATVRSVIGTTIATTAITVELEGNDGYVAITGVNEGDIIAAP